MSDQYTFADMMRDAERIKREMMAVMAPEIARDNRRPCIIAASKAFVDVMASVRNKRDRTESVKLFAEAVEAEVERRAAEIEALVDGILREGGHA